MEGGLVWITVFERRDAFKGDAKMVWVEESGGVVEEFYVLWGMSGTWTCMLTWTHPDGHY